MNASTLLVIAVALIFGVVGARLFKAVKAPQVVGYIIIGLILGASGFNVISKEMVQTFVPLNYLALGIIGFLVGGELKKSVFKKFGKSMIVILVLEGMLAFTIVTFLTGYFTKNWGLAMVLGALASATAPAATVDVLWEYKAAGVLTTMVFAIVALDDGLALLLYGFANAIAQILIEHHEFSVMNAVVRPLYEIGGSAALGIVVAYIYKLVLDLTKKQKHERDLMLSFTFGSIVLIIALSLQFDLDLILAEMFFGAAFVNIAPHYSKRVFDLMKGFAAPIYIIFFVLAGARLDLRSVTLSTLILAVLYVVGRTSGKIAGSALGARISGSSKNVARYLGLCLFSQAGVTIGLAISSSQTIPELGLTVVSVVTLTTFLVQIIGPPFVKFGITKAGEINKNITEDEMLQKHTVREVMDAHPPIVQADTSLNAVIDTIATSGRDDLPVIDSAGDLAGVVSLSKLKPLLNVGITGQAIIAEDLMSPVVHTVVESNKLNEAYSIFKNYGVNYLPVVSAEHPTKLEGFLTTAHVDQVVRDETLKLREIQESSS